MNDDLDDDIEQRVEKALTEDLSSLDQSTARKLQAARYNALEAYAANNKLTASGFPHGLIPGIIFASSLCVAVGVWLVQGDGGDHSQSSQEQMLLQNLSARGISSNELEMVEELEFYEWLDSNGYAG